MKRYLVRAGFNPLKTYTPYDLLRNNFIGDNSGNLFFAYGVMNVLRTEDTEIEQTYKWRFTAEDAAIINERYDAVVLPMADAFREPFINALKGYTDLINRLTIPVVVIGIGLRAPYEPGLNNKFIFDEAAKEFVKAVLDHSAMLGLRGEITAEYLKRLGFLPEKDFTVIGCPSLYTYGDNIHTHPLKKDIKKLAFNANTLAPDVVSDFIINTVKKVPDHYLIQQKREEFIDMYIGRYKGRRMIKNRVVENIFNTTDFLEMNKADRVKFFLNVPQWIKFVDGFDLFIGDRFHGSVSAILAGTPHVILPFDSRTRELTEYHNITSIHPHEIKEGSSIHDYIHKLDFKSFEKRHRGNFNHYVDFLKTNELDNIFTGNKAAEKGKSPLEREMEVLYDEIHCVEALHGMDKIERIIKYNTFALKRKVGHIWRKF